MRLIFLSAVVVATLSCGPQCEQASPTPTSVCRLPNDGAIEAGTPFVIRTLPAITGGSCQVSVSGSQLSLTVDGSVCRGGLSSARPVPPAPVQCQVPALDAGTYSVLGTSFSVPSTGGTTLPACP